MDEPVAYREEGQLLNRGPREAPHDPYGWMRDDGRSRPDVLAYLDAENEYASQHLARLDALADDLADEMSAPLPDVEWRPPRAVGDYEYAERRGEGDDYWDVLRRPRAAVAGADERSGGGGGEEGGEDEATAAAAAGGPGGGGGWRAAAPFNRLARGHAYFDVARWAPAPGGAWLAFAVDTRGDEEYSLYVLPLGGSSGDEEKEGEGDDDGSEGGDAAKAGSGGAGSHGPSAWEGPGAPVLVARGAAAGGQVAWSADSRALLYLEQPGSNERQGGSATRVLRRRVAAAPGNSAAAAASPGDAAGDAAGDAVLLELDAGALDLELSVSSSGSFLMLKYGAGDGDAVLALDMHAASTGPGIQKQQQQHAEPSSSSAAASEQREPPGRADSGDSRDEEGPSELARAEAAGWRVVLDPYLSQECQQADHWQGDVFLLAVDDADTPDGRVDMAAVPPPFARHGASGGEEGRGGGGGSSKEEVEEGVGPWAEEVRQPLLLGGDAGGSGNSSGSAAAKSEAAGGGGGANSTDGGRGGGRFGSGVEVRGFAVTKGHVAVSTRRGGVCVVQVFGWDAAAAALRAAAAAAAAAEEEAGRSSRGGGSERGGSSVGGPLWLAPPPAPAWELSFGGDATAVVGLGGASAGFDGSKVRLSRETFVSPLRQYDLDLVTRSKALAYREGTAASYDEGRYESRMEWAVSHDGVEVPMTVAWRRDKLQGDGSNPAVLWGYGAYGSKKFPGYDPADVALLDRGFVLAVGHIRGGSELGAAWHAGGRQANKPNTFHDLLACARRLAAAGFTSPGRLTLWGRSAGGLAVGAALNLDPACCAAAVLDVPFLDPLRTMLDASLLLTVKERPEWGDPIADQSAFDTILSYSPYDNLRDAPYPNLLVTASLWDRRVNFWEPLKYVAKLRYMRRQRRAADAGRRAGPADPAASSAPAGCGGASSNSGGGEDRQVLLQTDMAAGHFAASGAGERLRQRAEKVAFLVRALGADRGC